LLRQELARKVSDVLDRLIASSDLPETARVEFEILDTKNPDHGDYSCNLALIAAKPAGMNPRAIGEKLQKALASDSAFNAVDIAGPGFLNFKLKPETISRFVPTVLELGEKLPSALGLGLVAQGLRPKLEVEFVSVNPNGPITVGSARGAAFGDTYSRILQAAGNEVTREYYINDGVNSEQMRLFSESVRFYVVLRIYGEYKDSQEIDKWDTSLLALINAFAREIWPYRESEFKETRDDAKLYELWLEFASASARDGVDPNLVALAQQVLENDKVPYYREHRPNQLFQYCSKTWVNGMQLPPFVSFPEKGYKGTYVQSNAERFVQNKSTTGRQGEDFFLEAAEEIWAHDGRQWFQQRAEQYMLDQQRLDLHVFGIDFDIWFSEQKDLHEKNKVIEALEWLEQNGNAYRAIKPENAGVDPEKAAAEAKAKPEDDEDAVADGEPALWLRSSVLGDDKDRVLLRADGRPTYLAAEVAYLKDKFDRGYEKCYLVLGPDHHGYIGRTYAVVKALGKEPVKDFEIIIFQIVRFVKDGKPAPMRKRDGNIYELRDLITELGQAVSPNASPEEQQNTGKDVARFFYLMRSHETHMDFDIDLATKQSDENPVFYVQYAHARICGVIRKALGSGLEARGSGIDSTLLIHPRELALIKKIIDLPEEVQRCAKDFGVHRIATFAVELARSFHAFYDACRVIQPEEPELSQARLALAKAAQIGLKSALDLLGVSAPEKMERAVAEA